MKRTIILLFALLGLFIVGCSSDSTTEAQDQTPSKTQVQVTPDSKEESKPSNTTIQEDLDEIDTLFDEIDGFDSLESDELEVTLE